jgi:predicted RNase H-like HicB family nuclease
MRAVTCTTVLPRERDGAHSASVPALHVCHTQGATMPEVQAMAMDGEAIDLYMESLVVRGKSIPGDGGRAELDLSGGEGGLFLRIGVLVVEAAGVG